MIFIIIFNITINIIVTNVIIVAVVIIIIISWCTESFGGSRERERESGQGPRA